MTERKRGLSSAGRASALQAEGHRFEPYRSHFIFADVAQLAEQLICNQQVIGSSPIIGCGRELGEREIISMREPSRSPAEAVSEHES